MYTLTKSAKTTLASLLLLPLSGLTAQSSSVSGRVTVLDRGDRQARDVGQAVVWLETDASHAVTPDTVQVQMNDKEFQPGVVVVTTGSAVSYPNRDPFNHNVFSLSPEGPFDLGLYGRGEERTTVLNQAGVLRVYCNVHARMSSYVVVRDNPFFAQPAGDGSFVIEDVPPGRYEIVAWHERAAEPVRQPVTVGGSRARVELELDARRYERTQHLNKYGKPYKRSGRRY